MMTARYKTYLKCYIWWCMVTQFPFQVHYKRLCIQTPGMLSCWNYSPSFKFNHLWQILIFLWMSYLASQFHKVKSITMWFNLVFYTIRQFFSKRDNKLSKSSSFLHGEVVVWLYNVFTNNQATFDYSTYPVYL